jgi:anaerobic magnesium-protoporphyrin IX monomethyl ester cyclase
MFDVRSPRPGSVLVVRPPEVPTYFNAGHHLPVFLVSAHLRQHAPDIAVDAVDAGALNVTWKELGDRLWRGRYEVIALMNDLEQEPVLGEFIERARELCPSARIVTFGRLSAQLPAFFERYDLDGIVASGDYEAGVLTFVRWLNDPSRPRPGVAVRSDGHWLPPEGLGAMLPVEEWSLPSIDEIPYDAYDRLYQREDNRFCGLPGRRELVVPVARGCPIGCQFCEVWRREGRRERRLPVDRVMGYILESFSRAPFDYVAMYAPTFTLRRPWVLELCEAIQGCGREIRWKCTTTIEHLDEALLSHMAASGCVRVSVGVETLEPESQAFLPRAKRCAQDRVDELAACCAALGIELNCFVILGLPGATVEGMRETVERLRGGGARVRPMLYAPYHEMDPEMDEAQIAGYNRQLAPSHASGDDAAALYAMFHGE